MLMPWDWCGMEGRLNEDCICGGGGSASRRSGAVVLLHLPTKQLQMPKLARRLIMIAFSILTAAGSHAHAQLATHSGLANHGCTLHGESRLHSTLTRCRP